MTLSNISKVHFQVGNGTTSGSLGFSDVANKGTLIFNQPDSNEFTNSISGTGSVSQQGAATLTFSGNNIYSGPTLIGAGTLQVGNGNTSGSLGSGPVTNNAALVFNRADSVTQSAAIRGTGNLTQQGAGTTILVANFLNDGVNMYRNGTANNTTDIGELGGTSLAIVGLGTVAQNQAVANPTWRVGGKNTSATFAGAIINDGTTSIIKVGTGAWILSGVNTYSGSTTISNGVLALLEPGSIDNTSLIDLATNTVLDVSGRTDGTLNLNGTLQGFGTVRGSVAATDNATVSPGENGVGRLTITNALTLSGGTTVNMDLDPANATNDGIAGLTSATYHGVLNLNFSGSLAAGNAFKLFAASTYSGTFDSLNPTTPGAGLAWDTNSLAVSGILKVVASQPAGPTITSIVQTGSTLTISGSGGNEGTAYYVLTSTNVALPLTQWSILSTNQFGAGGSFNFTTPNDSHQPQQFYVLQLP